MKMAMAKRWSRSGRLRSANIVPLVTENWCAQLAAFPNVARGDLVRLEATALWTIRLAAIARPAEALEGGASLIVGHARNGAK